MDLQISQLPTAQTLDGTELVPVQQRGVTVQTTVGQVSAQPALTAPFLTVSASGLANARYFTTDANFTLTDTGAGGTLTIHLVGAAGNIAAAGNGLLVKNGAALSGTSIAVTGPGLVVANADGTAGSPTISLTGLTANIASTVGTGLLYVSGTTATLSAGTAPNQYLQWNGTGLFWAPGLASYPQIANDTATATPLYPLFTATTLGNLINASVSTTELTFTPSTGVLSSPQLTSTVATGTAPLSVASTTMVNNLYVARAALADVATNVTGGAAGSLPYQTAGSTTTTLPLGTTGYVLTAGATAPAWAAASTITAGNASQLLGATWAVPGTIGSTTPNTGAFTTLSATGQITSTVTTGTAPFVVSSTTQVANLNAATAGAASTASVASNLTGGTTGAVAYQTGANTTTTLPLGTTGYVLTAGASAPVWAAGSTITAGNASQLLGATWAVPGTIGSTTPNTGAFTTLSASSTVSGTGFSTYLASPPAIGGTAAAAGAFTTLSASSTVSGAGFGVYLAQPPSIGIITPAGGAFTTLSATGQITSTVTTGTAPLVIASTTNVPNLNASSLSGATFASPGNIGSTTPSAAAFTTLSTTGRATIQSWVTGTQSIATAGATTTFAVATPFYTIFTGTLNQTVVLPNATTLVAGQRYGIDNNSTGVITVQTNGGATLWTSAAGSDLYLTLTNNGTAAGTWNIDYNAVLVTTAKSLTVSNTMTLAGTDGTTMTFPAVSSTIASIGDVIAFSLALG